MRAFARRRRRRLSSRTARICLLRYGTEIPKRSFRSETLRVALGKPGPGDRDGLFQEEAGLRSAAKPPDGPSQRRQRGDEVRVASRERPSLDDQRLTPKRFGGCGPLQREAGPRDPREPFGDLDVILPRLLLLQNPHRALEKRQSFRRLPLGQPKTAVREQRVRHPGMVGTESP